MKRTIQWTFVCALVFALLVLPTAGGNTACADVIGDVISITAIYAPTAYSSPDYYGAVSTGEGAPKCAFENREDELWWYGVRWYDLTDDCDMNRYMYMSHLPGHAYKVFVSLVPVAGYAFQEGGEAPKVLIDGHEATIESVSAGNLLVSYVYEPPIERVGMALVTGLDQPVAGASPDCDLELMSDGCEFDRAAGDRNGVAWLDVTANAPLPPDGVFAEGHEYAVTIHLAAKTYFTFFDGSGRLTTTITVDGGTVTMGSTRITDVNRADDKHISFTYYFGEAPGAPAPALVERVAIADLKAPVAGETPDYDVTVTGEGAVLNAFSEPGGVKNGVLWIDDGTYMSPDAAFRPGRAYTVRVFVNSNAGYTFFQDDEFATAATINGEAAEAHRYETPTSAYFSYTFPALAEAEEPEEPTVKLISSVDIAITPPEAGQNPSFDVTLTGEGCRMAEDGNENWVHGVMFMDRTTYSTVTATDVFQEDETYEAHFSLIADEGYSFFNDANELVTTFTINGEAPWNVGGYDPYAPRHIFVRGLFPMSGKAHLFPTEVVSFFPYEGGLFFVSGGDVVTDANGLVEDPNSGAWYFCAAGQAQLQYSGLAEYDGEWFYLENGKLDTVRAGLVEYDGGRFMIAAGRILREVDGLIQEPNTGLWYYVAAGQVADYTTLVQYDGAWFYVINGDLATDFTGEVEYDGASFSVVAGQVVA